MYLVALAPGRGSNCAAMPGGAGDPRLRDLLCHVGQPVENLVDWAGATAPGVPAGGWGWRGADAWPTRRRAWVSTTRRGTRRRRGTPYRAPYLPAWSRGVRHGKSSCTALYLHNSVRSHMPENRIVDS